MSLVTLEQLLGNWFRFTAPITRAEIEGLDWDELMTALEIYCPDAEGKSVIVSDVDMTTYLFPAVSFALE